MRAVATASPSSGRPGPFGGFFGQYDKASCSAVPGLSGGLLGLPRPEARALPQSRPSRAVRSSRKSRSRRWQPRGRNKITDGPTIRATRSTACPASPTRSSGPTRTSKRRALRRMARCRRICRSSPRPATSRSTRAWYASGSTMLRDIATRLSGGRPGLHLRADDRLPRSAGRHADDRRHELQRRIPRSSDRRCLRRCRPTQEPFVEVSGPGQARWSERARRHGIPRLGGRSEPHARKQLGWQVMLYLDHHHRAALSRQAPPVGQGRALSLVARAALDEPDNSKGFACEAFFALRGAAPLWRGQVRREPVLRGRLQVSTAGT